jgi:hypothetical protein
MESWAAQSRWWIVTGYAVALVGGVISIVEQFPTILHGTVSTAVRVDLLVGPFVGLGSLWAWWWLSQLVITGDTERRVVRQGLVGLVFALICQSTLDFAGFASLVGIRSAVTWVLVSTFLGAIGALLVAIGFVAAFVGLRTSPSKPAEDWDT